MLRQVLTDGVRAVTASLVSTGTNHICRSGGGDRWSGWCAMYCGSLENFTKFVTTCRSRGSNRGPEETPHEGQCEATVRAYVRRGWGATTRKPRRSDYRS